MLIAAFVRCQQMILMSIEVIETSEPYTCIHYHRDDPKYNTTHDTPQYRVKVGSSFSRLKFRE